MPTFYIRARNIDRTVIYQGSNMNPRYNRWGDDYATYEHRYPGQKVQNAYSKHNPARKARRRARDKQRRT